MDRHKSKQLEEYYKSLENPQNSPKSSKEITFGEYEEILAKQQEEVAKIPKVPTSETSASPSSDEILDEIKEFKKKFKESSSSSLSTSISSTPPKLLDPAHDQIIKEIIDNYEKKVSLIKDRVPTDPNNDYNPYKEIGDVLYENKKKQIEVRMNSEPIPKIYKEVKDYIDPSELQSLLGPKLGNFLETTLKRREAFQLSWKKGQGRFIFESIKRGRLGSDLYLILFSILGMVGIPYYFYRKIMPQRKLLAQTGLNFDLETYEGDIDEISVHKDYNTMYKKEIEAEKLKRYKIKREILKLEKELYPDKV